LLVVVVIVTIANSSKSSVRNCTLSRSILNTSENLFFRANAVSRCVR
jgi:hypothetical protein